MGCLSSKVAGVERAASERAEERNLVLLRDSFVHRGVNGKHHVLAFEVLGDNLLALYPMAMARGLGRVETELVASKVSALNCCAY